MLDSDSSTGTLLNVKFILQLELDRFIPNRSSTNWDYARSVLTGKGSERCFGEIKPGMFETNVKHTQYLKKELGVDTSRIFYYRNNRKPPEEVNCTPPKSLSMIQVSRSLTRIDQQIELVYIIN